MAVARAAREGRQLERQIAAEAALRGWTPAQVSREGRDEYAGKEPTWPKDYVVRRDPHARPTQQGTSYWALTRLTRQEAKIADERFGDQRAQAAANDEADRLAAIADELDRQQGRRPGYQYELTAERAARIRARLGEDLVRDARLEAMPQTQGEPLEHWAIGADPVSGYYGTRRLDGEPETPANKEFYDGIESAAAHDAARAAHEPELQGAARDAEIDRLAVAFPEADEEAEQDAMYEEGEDEAYLAGAEFDADLMQSSGGAAPGAPLVPAWLAETGAEADYPLDNQPGREADDVQAPEPEPGGDAATWSPALESGAAAEDALHAELGRQPERAAEATQGPDIVADYLRRDLEERATAAEALRRLEARALAREHIAQASHDGGGATAAREQAGAFRQARLHAQAEAYGTAAALQEDAAQADRERGELAPGPPAPSTGDLWDREAERARQHLGRWTAEHGPDGGYAESLRQDVARYEQWGGEARASAQPAMERMSPESDQSPEPMDAARWAPLTRAEAAERDPDLAEIFDRAEELAAEAGAYETAANLQVEAREETGAPDHLYGSPECAEADPEGAHFGQLPGEPQDTGRWPVLQADYGRMYIGPQAQAEAV